MSISKQEVEHVAMLARLELTEQEKESYTKELNAILGFMDKLNELDTSNVTPTAHVLNITNVLREDEVRPGLDRELVLQNAPAKKEGQFRVPRIV
ncbi:Asp-tRNA(Asn)/Glu-tRNA(Gln) amidotransferase subunit GatC [Bacillota bacterium LX-D]|nr:Asp-tRNA(Asn)/Glu-tRNA(Gln) amidotransferase subunit GatC [Bacillota bacterium LX-D]